jgi:hypothetical protein
MAICFSIECCFVSAVFPEDGCYCPKCIGEETIYMITNRCAMGWKFNIFLLTYSTVK